MEDNSTLMPTGIPTKQQDCISCGNPQILHGYPNALCAECREKYIKFPVPLWVKAFGLGILALVVFALFTSFKSFTLGIRFEKGVKAEEQKNFVTEQKLMEGVLKDNPDYLDAKAHLLIAAFYNGDMATAGNMSEKMLHVPFENDELLAKVNAIIDEANNYVAGDTLVKYLQQYPDSVGGLPDNIYRRIMSKDSNDLFTRAKFASVLINEKNYQLADSLLKAVLARKSEFMLALQLEVSITRLNKDTKACFDYCNRLLAINNESVFAISCIARSYMKDNKPKEGLEYALKAFKIKPDDPYTNATVILAYHFNKMFKERDALINNIKQGKDSVMQGYLEYPLDVINHKDSI